MHFQGRIFVPFERVHHLTPGISLARLAEIGISISRQSALTAIEGEAFLRLKEQLASDRVRPVNERIVIAS